jgi:hypothetical protein
MTFVRNFRLLLATLLLLVGIGSAQTLVSIELTPPVVSGHADDAVSVQVFGTYNDGSVQDVTALASWSIADTTVASVSDPSLGEVDIGLLEVAGNGFTTVTASYNGLSSTVPVNSVPGDGTGINTLSPGSIGAGSELGIATFSTLDAP